MSSKQPWQADSTKQSSNLQKYLNSKKREDTKESHQKPAAENIIDSRITEKRPEANITIEKRKLLNNNLVKGDDVDLHAEQLDKLAKASPPVLPPPFSQFKKDAPLKAGAIGSPKLGLTGGDKSTDESSDANNYNSAFSQKSLTR